MIQAVTRALPHKKTRCKAQRQAVGLYLVTFQLRHLVKS